MLIASDYFYVGVVLLPCACSFPGFVGFVDLSSARCVAVLNVFVGGEATASWRRAILVVFTNLRCEIAKKY
jgi:hypothetical protein